MRFLFLLIAITIFVPAWSQETGEEEVSQAGSWNTEQMPFNYQNIQVPRALWQVVKQIIREEGASEAVVNDFSVLPINMQVELYSEDSMVLRDGQNHRLIFIEGGGIADLYNYVPGKGDFRLRMTPGFTEQNPFHILYISDSPGKEIGGDKWGNGCGKIFDLTQQYQVFTGVEGVGVTGARRHYMHLLAGTYIFFQLVDDRIFLGYIQLTDSRYPQFSCQ